MSRHPELLLTEDCHQVDFYITGHDHNQQHWAWGAGAGQRVEHVIAGAGGKSGYEQEADHVK